MPTTRITCPRPASCWCPAEYSRKTPDIRRETRLERKRVDRSYIRKVIYDLEKTEARGWISESDAARLQMYRQKLRRLSW